MRELAYCVAPFLTPMHCIKLATGMHKNGDLPRPLNIHANRAPGKQKRLAIPVIWSATAASAKADVKEHCGEQIALVT